jgi:hypothetical protein
MVARTLSQERQQEDHRDITIDERIGQHSKPDLSRLLSSFSAPDKLPAFGYNPRKCQRNTSASHETHQYGKETRMIRLSKIGLFCAALLLGISLFGCGGGGAKATVTSTDTTVGQELLDLDKAYKDGILTEKEYEKQKKKILKRKQ